MIEADSIPVDLAVPRDRNGTFGPHLDRISRQHCVGNIVARVALKRQAGGFGKASCRGQNAGRGTPGGEGRRGQDVFGSRPACGAVSLRADMSAQRFRQLTPSPLWLTRVQAACGLVRLRHGLRPGGNGGR